MGTIFSRPVLVSIIAIAISVYVYICRRRSQNKKILQKINKLPRTPDQLTLTFLQEQLGNNLQSFQIQPLVVEDSKGVERNDGGGASGSNLVRLLLKWKTNSNNQPSSVICKTSNLQDIPRAPSLFIRVIQYLLDVNLIWMLHNEYDFFVSAKIDIAAKFDIHIPHVYVALQVPSPVPTADWFSQTLMDSRPEYRTLLIIEDFPHLKSGFAGMTCDQNSAIQSVKQLARFHANFWSTDSEKSNKLLKRKNLCFFQSNLVSGANSGTNGLWALRKMKNWFTDDSLERCIVKWNKPDHVEFLNSFGLDSLYNEKEAHACRQFRNKCNENESFRKKILGLRSPQTLCHGDFHGGNCLWDTTDDKSETCVLVDFQFVGTGMAVWDLNYFFGTTTHCSDYKYHQMLLNVYHNELITIGGVKNYSRKELDRDMIQHLTCNLIFMSNSDSVDLVSIATDIAERDRDEKGKIVITAKYLLIKRILTRIVVMYEEGVLDQI